MSANSLNTSTSAPLTLGASLQNDSAGSTETVPETMVISINRNDYKWVWLPQGEKTGPSFEVKDHPPRRSEQYTLSPLSIQYKADAGHRSEDARERIRLCLAIKESLDSLYFEQGWKFVVRSGGWNSIIVNPVTNDVKVFDALLAEHPIIRTELCSYKVDRTGPRCPPNRFMARVHVPMGYTPEDAYSCTKESLKEYFNSVGIAESPVIIEDVWYEVYKDAKSYCKTGEYTVTFSLSYKQSPGTEWSPDLAIIIACAGFVRFGRQWVRLEYEHRFNHCHICRNSPHEGKRHKLRDCTRKCERCGATGHAKHACPLKWQQPEPMTAILRPRSAEARERMRRILADNSEDPPIGKPRPKTHNHW